MFVNKFGGNVLLNNDKNYRVSLHCPICRRRFFDMLTPLDGRIEIKCPKCSLLIDVDLKTNKRTVIYK